ncbi:MAG: thioredoxin domain-containing protein [Candidatus Muirbacterium halophilum]|nr:thioredoxin domain-containing protein [Candidatus Muirbacterium halophilum]
MKFLKGIIVVGFLFILGLNILAHDHVHGPDYIHNKEVWGNSLNNALNKAQKNDFLLIEFSKPYCNGYKQFASSVLEQNDVENFIKQNFIAVELHPLKYKNLIKAYNVVTVPTFIVADNMGRELDRLSGYPKKEVFKNKLDFIKTNKDNFFNLKKRALNGDATLIDYFNLAEKYFNMKKYKKAEKYYNLSTGSNKEYEKNIALGNINFINKNFNNADKFYDFARRNFNNSKTVDFFAGYTAYMEREHAKSIEYFENFLNNSENTNSLKNKKINSIYLCTLASVFLKDFDKAEAYSEKFKKSFPDQKQTAGQLTFFVFTEKNKVLKKENDEHDEHDNDEHYHEGCGGV